MGTLGADGQEPDRRPTGSVEVAQHAEGVWYAPGGKSGVSCTYTVVERLAEWVRRRVRWCYWRQWKQPRTRRRQLLARGIAPAEVHMASRSRKGYWRMSQMSLVRHSLSNRWLEEQGVPDMRATWIKLHYGPQARV